MSIFQNNYGAPGGIVAHLSSIACSRASEEAKGLPGLLSPELLPRSGVWPKSFQKLGPAADHIGLYLFPDSERCWFKQFCTRFLSSSFFLVLATFKDLFS